MKSAHFMRYCRSVGLASPPAAFGSPFSATSYAAVHGPVAPGTAFGPGGETGLRLCFARKASDLTEAVARLQKALSA